MVLLFILFIINLATATLPNSQQIQTFVNTHNYYRSVVDPPTSYMPPVSWSTSLANSANNWAVLAQRLRASLQRREVQCNFQHSGTPNVGENLYVTSSRTLNPANFNPTPVVNSWGGERWYYNYGSNSCTPGQVCGHYTQIVWLNSVNIGCAFQDCPVLGNAPFSSGTIAVCQYSPRGNIVGLRPYCRF